MARRKPQTSDHSEPLRAAIYVRVSTADQAAEGHGLDSQRSRCKAMIEAKGWQFLREYADEGISGTKSRDKRSGLDSMLSDAQRGELDVVVTLALDRLGRKTRLVLDLVEELTSCNVALVSCKESLDATTATGKFCLTLFAGLSQLERDQVSERTTAALGELARQTGYKGGRIPYGYRRGGAGDVAPLDREVEIVRMIFEMDRRRKSLRQIAEILNLQGVPRPRKGQRWYASTIKAILRNEPTYRGKVRYESGVSWPAVL